MQQKTDTENELQTSIQGTVYNDLNEPYVVCRRLLSGVVNKIMKSKTAAEDVLSRAFIKIRNQSLLYDYTNVSLFTQMLQITLQTALENIQDKKTAIDLLKKDIRAYINEVKVKTPKNTLTNKQTKLK